ncbi:hypothetical protein [Vibrio parahaemolyticus]|uniref:hypothetical protein n=1 Tax=Vibrio parahaemolyticus TaxID=670 RepID=UPI002361BBCA|nr:hypothetical protein [Vibrio parahaemolyticus]MEA5295105.1 hypothetical protein [Vibrio parahaemolyticus]
MFYGLNDSRIWAENADLPKQKNELLKRAKLKKPKKLALSHNALLRGEQCTEKAAAHRLNHKTHRMLKMPRIANPA